MSLKFDKDTPWYQKIKLLRVSKELTQTELADALGVSIRSVIRWERGESLPLPVIRSGISKLLGTTTTDLFGKRPKVKDKEATSEN